MVMKTTRPASGSTLVAAAILSFACLRTMAQADYLGETPPGDEPQVFGRGAVSVDGRNTHALQFSPDGRMLIFSCYPDRTSFRMVRTKDG
jgi:hypothetical protein